MAYFKCNHGYDRIFGNGSLGNVHIDADTNLSSMFTNFVEDTGVFELNCKNFIVDSGKTLTADKRNAGVIIRCKGDCTIHGTIANQNAPRSIVDAEGNDIAETLLAPYYPAWMISNGTGGKGGAGNIDYPSRRFGVAKGGEGQVGRFYGGGYSGGGGGGDSIYEPNSTTTNTWRGGLGGDATDIKTNTSMFVGGATAQYGQAGSYGGGGGGAYLISPSRYGGNGGGGAGASGGNSTGTVSVSTANSIGGGPGGGAGNIGGGVVIVYCAGTLIIDGTLNCKGRNGGQGGYRYWSNTGESFQGAGNGGGAGGGRIYVLAKNGITLTGGTFDVTGGDPPNNSFQSTSGLGGTKHYITYTNYKNGVAPSVITS